MDSLFFGESANAFFSFENISVVRKLLRPLYPLPYYALLNDPKIKPPPKTNGEIRLLAMDIATAGGSKNDATSISLIQMVPMLNCQYTRNVLYMETIDGGHGQDQAIRLKQLYDDLEADFVVVDTNGVGMTVYDQLVQELYDEERQLTYEAWSCINDERMAERSRDPENNKVIYSIKATQKMNSDMAVLLRDCMKRGKIRFLTDEAEGNEILDGSKGFHKLSVEEQFLFQAPYYQTTAFCNETINLDYEMSNGNVRVKEASGMRKDRYSSVSYGNYIANEIEREMLKQDTSDFSQAPNCVTSVNW